jgi:hypothetical protein
MVEAAVFFDDVRELDDLREVAVDARDDGRGLTPAHSTPEQITEMIKAESPAMGRVLKAAGVEPE